MIQPLSGSEWTVRVRTGALAVGRAPSDAGGVDAGVGASVGAGVDASVGASGTTAHPAPAGIATRVIAATVPGCVHDALRAAGVIGDCDVGDGESAQAWVGHTGWDWQRTFDLAAAAREHDRVDLVFECIDCCGDVWLNGGHLGHVENRFHPWRFDARAALRTLGNSLGVHIAAPVTEVLGRAQRFGARPVNGDWTPYPFLRTSACSYGWDWGPKLPSVGLGNVWLHAWSVARLASVRPMVTACDELEATLTVHADLEFGHHGIVPPNVELEVEVLLDDGRRIAERVPVRGTANEITLTIPQPPRWWPRGIGAQRLHGCAVRLVQGATPLDTWSRRIGLRTVALDTTPDTDGNGSAFTIRVNGLPIFCRGANWIPVSSFPVSVPPTTARGLLELACEANLNMLRVWGGGVYEPDSWYEACDELGLMVWQDFMFACATYPEEQPYEDAIHAEARHQVARLSAHPSVVLWCGGNEDVLAWWSWGFRDRLTPGQSWGERIWTKWLPAICAELDPTRPYWTESPWSGSLERHPNDPDHGDRHTWDLKLDGYRTQVPRFCSEFGQQSQPAVCTWRGAVGDGALRVGHPAIASRQRAGGGDDAQYGQVLPQWFTHTEDFGAWVWQGQLLQARAMRWGIEWMRAHQPRCMGALFWQWNDVWTGPSWSVIDVARRPKPAYHAVAEACAPRTVALVPRDGGVQAVAFNDTPEPWSGTVTLMRVNARGQEIASSRVSFTAPPLSSTVVARCEEAVGGLADASCELYAADCGDARSVHLPCHDLLMQLPFAEPVRECVRSEQGGRVEVWRVTATSLIVDAWLEPLWPWERTHGNLRTLLAGESMEVRVEWLKPCADIPVRVWVRSANEFGGIPVPPRVFRP